MVEMGWFCIYLEVNDFDVLWVVWGVMICFVDEQGVEMLFGCFSFWGIEVEIYLDVFDMLVEKYIVFKWWLFQVKVFKVF